ncbi:MAG: MFS transporter, partial [Erysipelotrichales bacterium]|nr:MFS transporter [Erysipelotrichales bacterium]
METTKAAETTVYRRAKLWQIILAGCNGFNGMAVYTLIGFATYSAGVGYGISTLIIGGLLTFTRIFDAITDPVLAFLYDRVNTKWGKVRPLLFGGWLIQSIGLLAMFTWMSSKGFGIPVFVGLYMLYVIGYTIVNMTAQTVPALLTNDPKQRPTVGVWFTVFNYLVPMILTIVLNVVMLPKFGGTINQAFLTAAAYICVAVSLFGVIMVMIGVSEYDKPENFQGTGKTQERLKWKDMWGVL